MKNADTLPLSWVATILNGSLAHSFPGDIAVPRHLVEHMLGRPITRADIAVAKRREVNRRYHHKHISRSNPQPPGQSAG
jgi:hypothetical protein